MQDEMMNQQRQGSNPTGRRVLTNAAEKANFADKLCDCSDCSRGQNVRVSQWGWLLGLHPALPRKRRGHSRTGNNELSGGSFDSAWEKCLIWRLQAWSNTLVFKEELSCHWCLWRIPSPRRWLGEKKEFSFEFLMIKLWWLTGFTNVDLKIWVELRQVIHRFHGLKKTWIHQSTCRDYGNVIRNVQFYYNAWCPGFSAAGWKNWTLAQPCSQKNYCIWWKWLGCRAIFAVITLKATLPCEEQFIFSFVSPLYAAPCPDLSFCFSHSWFPGVSCVVRRWSVLGGWAFGGGGALLYFN